MKARLCIGTFLFLLFLFAMLAIMESDLSFLATVGLIIANFLIGLLAAKLTKEE